MTDAIDDTDDTVWRALADPRRRAMLDALAAGPMTTGALCDAFGPGSDDPGLTRTAVMRHVELLVEAELVTVRREGRVRWNHLNPVPLQRVCDRWMSRHVQRLAGSANRLKALAESQAESQAEP